MRLFGRPYTPNRYHTDGSLPSVLHAKVWDPTLTREGPWPQKLNALLPLVLTPAGLLTYMLYQWMAFGNPWLFSAEETHYWQRSLDFPWVGFLNVMHEIVTAGPLTQLCLNDTIFTLWPLGSLIMGWKLLPLHYSLFSLAMILFMLCEPSRMRDSYQFHASCSSYFPFLSSLHFGANTPVLLGSF